MTIQSSSWSQYFVLPGAAIWVFATVAPRHHSLFHRVMNVAWIMDIRDGTPQNFVFPAVIHRPNQEKKSPIHIIRQIVKERVFYGQADRKGRRVSPVGPDRKQMWKCWSFCHWNLILWYSKHILSQCEGSQKFACPLRLCYTSTWPFCGRVTASTKEEWDILAQEYWNENVTPS